MRKAERRNGGGLLCESGKAAYRLNQLFAHEYERVLHDHDVGVVGHVARRGAKVDDAFGAGAQQSVCVDVRHNVVAGLLFARGNDVIVYRRDMRLKFVHLRFCDRQPELHFGFGQRYPQFAPGRIAHIGREKVGHFLARVACYQRVFIAFFHLYASVISA
ncbi:hypothetical protein SDC9_179854 [bioreactor metagenome]|uniref:Uncharacterized protein n=1 Tax=bioreactor metagenome TaxID=1076179 RepID=A0A645H1L9_9ZZZZ